MRIIIALSILFYCIFSNAETIKIAVIDTGFTKHADKPGLIHPKLCHENIDVTGKGMKDEVGHGTHVAYTIAKHAKNVDYCLILIKYYHQHTKEKKYVKNFLKALQAAIVYNPDIVNISGGGSGFILSEYRMMVQLSERALLFLAAGNKDELVSKYYCKFFPACYLKESLVVGNGSSPRNRHSTSNHGDMIDIWINGVDVSDGVNEMTGTSQSVAIATGEFTNFLSKKEARNARQNIHESRKELLRVYIQHRKSFYVKYGRLDSN